MDNGGRNRLKNSPVLPGRWPRPWPAHINRKRRRRDGDVLHILCTVAPTLAWDHSKNPNAVIPTDRTYFSVVLFFSKALHWFITNRENVFGLCCMRMVYWQMLHCSRCFWVFLGPITCLHRTEVNLRAIFSTWMESHFILVTLFWGIQHNLPCFQHIAATFLAT